MDQSKKAAVTRAQVWPRGPEVSESWQWDMIIPRLKKFQIITPRMALVPKLLCTIKAIGFHVCTHAQYTVANVVNMLKQAGAEKLPKTMLIALARFEVKFRSEIGNCPS